MPNERGYRPNSVVEFWVPGVPQPQGSMKTYARPGQRPIVTTANPKLYAWRKAVAIEAKKAVVGMLSGPCLTDMGFYLPRPKSHYRTGRYKDLLRDDAPMWHVTKPDGDKLLRAVFDALTTAGAWGDDCQVVGCSLRKRYAKAEAEAGVKVRIYPIVVCDT